MGKKLTPPTLGDDSNVARWTEDISQSISGLPDFSLFSTNDGPESSAITADRGTLGIEKGSGVTTLWVKTSDGTTGWIGVA